MKLTNFNLFKILCPRTISKFRNKNWLSLTDIEASKDMFHVLNVIRLVERYEYHYTADISSYLTNLP